MKIERTPLNGLLILTPKVISDSRGVFLETYRQSILNDAIGEEVTFVQDNKSCSKVSGTIRGLHVQLPPHDQGKLVTCVKGKLFDVAVDIRSNSPTYGQWYGAILSAENHKQLWIPPGFLHGFQTLLMGTAITYKCTTYYNKDSERVVAWNDPQIKIGWRNLEPNLSEKDLKAPLFNTFNSPF